MGINMSLSPLWISLKVALCATLVTFILGLLAARWVVSLKRGKAFLDGVFSLPMVLPPTVVGFFLLLLFGRNSLLGNLLLKLGIQVMFTWQGAVIAAVVVSFPLMYRTARGAFESFDETYAYSGQTLGLSNSFIFWRIRMPACRQGILAGAVLAFARALGEYGATSMVAGYTPGRTATISTTVYQLWRTDNDALALRWVLVNVAISAVVLLVVNLLEKSERASRMGTKREAGR